MLLLPTPAVKLNKLEIFISCFLTTMNKVGYPLVEDRNVVYEVLLISRAMLELLSATNN